MKIRRILFIGHQASPFAPAIIRELSKSYKVVFFDHFSPNLISKFINITKNYQILNTTKLKIFLNRYISDQLYYTALREIPDLIFFFKGKNISNEIITRLREKGFKVINWYPDYFDDWEWIKNNSPLYDYFFTPCLYVQKRLKNIGIKSYYIPFAAEVDNPIKTLPYKFNATFVGRYTDRRNILFHKVYEAGLLDIWGYSHWQKSRYKSRYHGQVTSAKCKNIIRQSKVTINTLTATDNVPIISVNYRIFETTGVGGFILSWYNDPLQDFYKLGKEIETFTTPQEALEKTKFYLKNEAARQKISHAGWLRTRKDHTYAVRLKQLFSYIR